MAPIKNAGVIFTSIPTGLPIPGEHTVYREDRTIDLDTVPLNGSILTKTNVLGIDPYLRGRMTYEYVVGEPILGHGVGVVLRSEDPSYKPGDHIYTHVYPFEEYAVLKKGTTLLNLKEPGIPWTTYMGALGMPGITAWVGWKQIAKAQKGETIYVSSAAGVVGSVICQIAKAEGLRVIASAGSDDKVQFLQELGVDVAFNYKTQDLDEVLKEHGPLDIYWDAVGGRQLETVINHMARFGRVVVCGYISGYNSKEPYGIKNMILTLVNDLTIAGFNNFHIVEKYGDYDFYPQVTKLVKEGKLKVVEQISNKLEDAAQLLLDTQTGKNAGKPIIVLSDD